VGVAIGREIGDSLAGRLGDPMEIALVLRFEGRDALCEILSESEHSPPDGLPLGVFLVCWSKARPKALRWGFLHAPGRLVRGARQRIVRILDGWPSAGALIGAYEKMAALC
jgi:hypothetical protein